jgi:hypothetical protein
LGIARNYTDLFLQNTYKHFDAPLDPFTKAEKIGLSLKETFLDYVKAGFKAGLDDQFRMFFGGVPIEKNNNESAYTYLSSRISSVNNNNQF